VGSRGRLAAPATVAPLNRPELALRRIVSDLTELGRRFALVGGLAVSVRAEPRLTRDADLVVAVVDDADAEALVHQVQARGWRVLVAVEHGRAERLATVRLVETGADPAGPVIDLLFASSGIEQEIVASADVVDVVSGLAVPVARIAHLIAMKVLARDDRSRPQDRVDLGALLRGADAAALAEARAALSLVAQRGFDRGRDLLSALDAARRELGD